MTFEYFIRYGSLWTLILGVLSLAFAIRNYRRQVNAQVFFEIAGRYDEMLQAIPINSWLARHDAEGRLPESCPETTTSALRYLAIVHFAFVLHELHYLSRDLWTILKAEHQRTVGSALFVREWQQLRAEFAMFPPFVTYIDSIQMGATQGGGDKQRPFRLPVKR
jgi:hypothetical protein